MPLVEVLADMQYQGMELLMQMLQKQAGEMGNK